MELAPNKLQNVFLEVVRKNPVLITGLLFKEEDVSIILNKQGNTVYFAYTRTYDKKTTRLLKEAKREHAQKKAEGYSRIQAFDDFTDALNEINKQI
jgi:hypothetical protein